MKLMTHFETERQRVDLSGVRFAGRVLDIGGGGEGVIARHSGEAVVSIDNRREELADAPDIGLKIVMDAQAMQFMDRAFDTVVFFYSLLYMDREEAAKALAEARRVLRPGGTLWIWDAVIPLPPAADAFVIQLDIQIAPGQSLSAGYGVGWRRGQGLAEVARLCEKAGFVIEAGDEAEWCFSLRGR